MIEELLANAYIKGASDLLQGKIEGMPQVIAIPNNATNGDMLQTIFEIEEIEETIHCVGVKFKDKECGVAFKKDWWNSPYKREVKNYADSN